MEEGRDQRSGGMEGREEKIGGKPQRKGAEWRYVVQWSVDLCGNARDEGKEWKYAEQWRRGEQRREESSGGRQGPEEWKRGE